MDTFSLLFFVRRNKTRKNGEVPIYLRITVNGQRSELSIKRTIAPTRWDTESGKVKGNKQDAREINQYIDLISTKAYKIQQKFLDSDRPFTAEMIRNQLQNRKGKGHGLVDQFTKEVDRIESLIGKGYAKNTYKRYKSC